MSELSPESPAEDVVEQRTDAYPDAGSAAGLPDGELPLEADPADAVEQAEEVSLDEDDYP